jgi:predicted acylesterase/phospholipase RssA
VAEAVAPTREVRLALVLNGGVSLAVWIGGVTREVDAARRLETDDPADTQPIYARILEALQTRLVVDVISGASAGGINGVLLGAAIYNDVRLPDLRDMWLSVGDFRKLLRSPAESNPPSLLRGDEVVLATVDEVLRGIWRTDGEPTPAYAALYVYVTATDLFGFPADFSDSFGQAWRERDHRRVFAFQYESGARPTAEPPPPGETGKMRPVVWLWDGDARTLMAEAARSSSSFPVAFEARQLGILDRDGRVHDHWLVDGGILDNQPFNPVLDRIGVLPPLPSAGGGAGPAIDRVLMYVVPYATEPGDADDDAPKVATAYDTYAAAGTLPRDLPKLEELERVARDLGTRRAGAAERGRLRRLDGAQLETAAIQLYDTYRATRYAASIGVFELWKRPDFPTGGGVIAQNPAIDPRTLLAQLTREEDRRPPQVGALWLPDGHARIWTPAAIPWQWGLSPAERIAAWALLFLKDVDGAGADREFASRLVAHVRLMKVRLRDCFRGHPGVFDPEIPPETLAELAYLRIEPERLRIQERFAELDLRLSRIGLSLQHLLNREVVRNALQIDEVEAPVPFTFRFASPRVRNALGHTAARPEQKLAGLKLGHFAGFLKRSWRANDWLWGRLDGAEHLVRSIVTDDALDGLLPPRARLLADAAFGGAAPEELAELHAIWREALHGARIEDPAPADPAESLVLVLANGSGRGRYEAVRTALAARVQMRILAEDLDEVADAARADVAAGASPLANGALWAQGFDTERGPALRRALFRRLDVAAERPQDEAASRLVLDVAAGGFAVTSAMLAGEKGGLPAAARGLLLSHRGATLSAARFVQLIAREPWLGSSVFAALVALVVWAAVSTSALVGVVFPGLTLATAAAGLALFTIGTGVFERPSGRPARTAGAVIFVGAPLAFGLLGLVHRYVGRMPSVEHWLDRHVGRAATLGVGGAALVAAALALALAVTVARPAPWRRLALGGYRVLVAASIAVAAGGVLYERWTHPPASAPSVVATAAQEHRGTVLVLLLLLVLAVAGLAELAVARLRRRS